MNTNNANTLFNVANNGAAVAVLHVRFDGRSRDVALDTLGVNIATPDDDVRRAVAQFLDIGLVDLASTVIERHANGNLTLRPEAVYG